jgi:hypothetical protein
VPGGQSRLVRQRGVAQILFTGCLFRFTRMLILLPRHRLISFNKAPVLWRNRKLVFNFGHSGRCSHQTLAGRGGERHESKGCAVGGFRITEIATSGFRPRKWQALLLVVF